MQNIPQPEWLERANRLALVSRLLSSTVHDVNNALQVIAGSVELLQMAPAASEMIQRRIVAIDVQTKRASHLLQDLSDFVRDARVAAERIDITALAKQVIASRHYSMTKLRMTSAVEGEPVFVKANPRHVQQILLNVVINAEEAAASSLVVRISQDGADGVVRVEDNAAVVRLKPDTTGESITKDAVESGFSRPTGGSISKDFVESGLSRTTSSNLGIGLEVSSWLAEKNGGSLVREELPTGGSRATLRLPVSP